MYCANCGTQLVQGLSYCNRCGFDVRTPTQSSTGSIAGFVTAITLLGVIGLGLMFGGALSFKKAGFTEDFIGLFVVCMFVLVAFTEFVLVKNLSKFSGAQESKKRSLPPVDQDLRLPQTSNLGEPVPSVTENTTRALEYERRK
jgi:high-affinity Fe2+/Pb2+ permease